MVAGQWYLAGKLPEQVKEEGLWPGEDDRCQRVPGGQKVPGGQVQEMWEGARSSPYSFRPFKYISWASIARVLWHFMMSSCNFMSLWSLDFSRHQGLVSKLEFGFEDISHWRTLSHNWPKPTIYLNEHIKHIGQPLPATHPNVTTVYTAGELVIFLSLFVCLFFNEYFLSLLIQSSIVQTKLRYIFQHNWKYIFQVTFPYYYYPYYYYNY